MGSDVTAEQETTGLQGARVAKIKDLRYMLLGLPEGEARLWAKAKMGEPPTIGSTYPNATRAFFGGRVNVEYIEGSAEAWPYLLPQLDAICELGRTLASQRENGLTIIRDWLAPVSLTVVSQLESGTI